MSRFTTSLLSVSLSIVALIACSRGERAVTGAEVARTVPERYRFLHGGFVARDDEETLGAALPFERIELETTGAFLPQYRAIRLHRDGRAELEGETQRHGRVRLFDYGRLCELLEATHLEDLAPTYDWMGFDAPTETVRAWPAHGGEPITVSDTGSAGPVALWSVRAALEGVASRIRWE